MNQKLVWTTIFLFSVSPVKSLSADLIYSPTLPDHVIGVTDLFVPANGKTYDVRFDERSFVDIFGDPLALSTTPTFWSGTINSLLASSARDALVSELNSGSPLPVRLRNESDQGGFDFFFIAYDDADNGQRVRTVWGGYSSTDSMWQSGSNSRLATGVSSNGSYAIFTEVSNIPEPNSIALLLTLAIPFIRSRIRKKKGEPLPRHQYS